MTEEKIETTPAAEEAPKKSTRVKKEAPAAPPRVNPIPGAPELDGKLPGDQGYNYDEAIRQMAEKRVELDREMKAASAVAKSLGLLRVEKQVVLTDHERWQADQRTSAKIEKAAAARKEQVAAVLKEMDLL